MSEEWYSADSWKWTYNQVVWLLSWLQYIRATGYDWPPCPKSSSYVAVTVKREPGEKVHKSNKPYKATWENERSILGHLENRLCRMRMDGLLVKMIYAHKDDPQWIGKCLNLPARVVIKRANDALNELVKQEQENIDNYYLTIIK